MSDPKEPFVDAWSPPEEEGKDENKVKVKGDSVPEEERTFRWLPDWRMREVREDGEDKRDTEVVIESSEVYAAEG